VLVQSESGFKDQLKDLSERLKTTAVFDGVGGAALNDMIDVISPGSTVYAYRGRKKSGKVMSLNRFFKISMFKGFE
jgi:NADPH:quinone reductase-like Zn-dependent oxidoreductase